MGRGRPYLSVAVALSAFVALAVVAHWRLQAPADPDGFYHIRHAWLYRRNGVLETAFPWVQYSAIRVYAADLWYGFHVLLLPLTAMDPAKGLSLGAWMTTVLALGLLYLALRTLAVRWPVLWVFVFALATGDGLYRLTMLRPHPLSLGLTLVLFAQLAAERSRGRLVALLLAGGALAWIHLALCWIAPVVALIVTLVRAAHRRAPDWPALGCVAAGLLAGWLLRPHPVGAGRLAYIQVVKLLLEKRQHPALAFGAELYPFAWADFVAQLVPVTSLAALTLGVLVAPMARKRTVTLARARRIALWSSLILGVGFFVLTFTVARRSSELFVGFAVLFVGLVATDDRLAGRVVRRPVLALGLTVLVLAAMALPTLHRFETYADTTAAAHRPERFKAISLWLADHARPGEIVFNVHWGMFPQLFFWNTTSYYVSGMDPVFQYVYDPRRYWENHFLAFGGAGAFTCPSTGCTTAEVVDTYDVLRRDFRASYIVVEKLGQPRLYRYLIGDPRFERILESGDDALFKIL